MSTEELGLAASTLWVVIAAVLVLFMQAGFAFLEAGLTRMKNVGHIAAKNALIDDVIDPRETRPTIIRGLRMATGKRVERPWRKHGVMPV